MKKRPPPPQKPCFPFKLPCNLEEFRRKLGLNQFDFWHPLYVTQPGGSRYEKGRSMPDQVKWLFYLRYILRVPMDDLPRLGKNALVGERLHEVSPARYRLHLEEAQRTQAKTPVWKPSVRVGSGGRQIKSLAQVSP